MTSQPGAVRRTRRPLGVVLIAAFLVIDAILAVAGEAFDLGISTRQDLVADPEGRVSLVIMGLVVLRVVAAVGLWAGSWRAWVLTMLLVGISLVLDLWLYWEGTPAYLRMSFDVVLALYLNQGAVRQHFGHHAGPDSPTDAGPAERAAPAAPGSGTGRS